MAVVPGPVSALPGPVALLLLVLSIAVLTVCLDRLRWWWIWWQGRHGRRRQWQQSLGQDDNGAAADQLEDWEVAMACGEPLLQSAALLAPLLGLVGTVFALMGQLSRLGPDLTLPPGASLQGFGHVLLSTALGLLLSLVASAALELNGGLRRWQISNLERPWRRAARRRP